MPIKVAFSRKTTYNLLGGCTYFRSYSSERNFDTYPINSTEAKLSRISRFVILDIPHRQRRRFWLR
ncbi:hypothetical protein EXU85_29885 [Spirosoma sp. KCTC 42546]|uniref:transglutaminase family protein n=1 Tax=Spirosoma sp. KCTC 42546 TaxID=2520506 RepID=UPI00115815E9|nr:hypothetical protein EXU85_29885 [Spirosoma sp. KCTC 42546]